MKSKNRRKFVREKMQLWKNNRVTNTKTALSVINQRLCIMSNSLSNRQQDSSKTSTKTSREFGMIQFSEHSLLGKTCKVS